MNKKNILLIIGSFVIAILCVIAFIKITNNDVKVFNDKDKYSIYLNELKNNKDVHSGLLIFPENVNNLDIIDFKFFGLFKLFFYSFLNIIIFFIIN